MNGTDRVVAAKQEMATFLDIAEADFDTVQACMRSLQNFVFKAHITDPRVLREKAVEILEVALGPDHRCVADALHILGVLYAGVDMWSAAARAHGRAVEILTGAFGAQHPCVTEIEEHIESVRAMQAEARLPSSEECGLSAPAAVAGSGVM